MVYGDKVFESLINIVAVQILLYKNHFNLWTNDSNADRDWSLFYRGLSIARDHSLSKYAKFLKNKTSYPWYT